MSEKAKYRPTERFSGLADLYASARPTYPADAIDFIIVRCALGNQSMLADIGCGTGISSRLFAARGIHVIGIEPNDDMRRRAEGESADDPNLKYQSGTGEKTNLADSSVDAVLAAQAFHWFEPTEALQEFHRILKPGGWTILMWNERDEEDQFTSDYGAIIRAQKETASVEMMRGAGAGQPLLESSLFRNAALDEFANEQIVDREGLINRACSASYAPKEAEALKLMKEQLTTVFTRFAVDERVSIKYQTLVFTGRRA